ncbi:amidohydrolase family protein [Salinimonas chungwhensis]|uniref:amidohydrolase family protein n=1 Tax=Salinimonas chungwhensis TaxID=265425 RepID=UPI00036B255B|nr:amidohydrolase family protein [Salinimonas chungwhensis]
MPKLIDTHVHLFDTERGQYEWLQPNNPPHWPDKHLINRSFSPHDLALPTSISLNGIVHIEAGFDNQKPWREIELVEQTVRLPLRTVAGGDITADDFSHTLDKLARFNSVCGIRHILDEQAVAVLSHPRALTNMQLLTSKNWHFEAQFSVSDSQATQCLLRLLNKTGARCIINHAGFMPGETVNASVWRKNLLCLAENPNVAIKASGWEMMGASRAWQSEQVVGIIEKLMLIFGTQRVMLGSNFPLCLFEADYNTYWQCLEDAIPALDKQALMFDNALQWYGFTLNSAD